MSYQEFIRPLLMGYTPWVSFVLGALLFLVFYFIYRLSASGYKKTLKKTANIRGFALFIGNLLLIMAGFVLALYAIGVSIEVIEMSDADKALLAFYIHSYTNLLWVLAGVFAAAVITWVIRTVQVTKECERDDSIGSINAKIREHFRKRNK